MRSSILMLSVALLAVLGLWMTGNATGVAVSDQEAAQLVGGDCQGYITHECSLDNCPAESAVAPSTLGATPVQLTSPRFCGGSSSCVQVFTIGQTCGS